MGIISPLLSLTAYDRDNRKDACQRRFLKMLWAVCWAGLKIGLTLGATFWLAAVRARRME